MPQSITSEMTMGVQALLEVHARYLQSSPNRPFDQMEIIQVTVAVNNLSLDHTLQRAALTSWSDEFAMTLSNGIYSRTLTLNQNSVYEVRITVVNNNGSKSAYRQFVDTTDANIYFDMDYVIRQEGIAKPIPLIDGALFKVTPPASMEFPKWTPGLKDSQGDPVPLPTSSAQLYDYVVNKISGVTLEDLSDYRGQTLMQRLLPGVYEIEISKTGYETRESVREITNADLVGNWDIKKL